MENVNPIILPLNQENQINNDDLNSQETEIQEVSDQSTSTFHETTDENQQQQEQDDFEIISTSEENVIPISVSQTKQRYDWTPYFITNAQHEKLDQNLDYLLNQIEGNGPNVQLRPNFYPNFNFKPINWGADENHFENQETYVNIFDKSDSENEDEFPKFTFSKKASRKLSYGSTSTTEFQNNKEDNKNNPNLIMTTETIQNNLIENSLKRNRLFLEHSNAVDVEEQRKEEIKEDYENLEYSLEYLPKQVERLKKNLKYFSAATIKALKKEVDLSNRFERAPMKHTSDLEFRENQIRDIFDSIIEAQNMVQPFVIADIFSKEDHSENKIFSLGQEQKQEMLKKLIFEILKKNSRKL